MAYPNWILGALTISTLLSCVPFRDSPFSDELLRDERNLNGLAIEKMGSIEEDGVIRLALLSDSHGNYKDLDRVVGEINQVEGLDFAVHLGDLSNNSYNHEYDQFIAQITKLQLPTFTLIGNHDALGAGPSLFAKAFGASNYIYESEHLRFVFWNSVNLENPRDFDPAWLLKQVEESSKPVLVFTHIPLSDPERYHGEVREILDRVLASPKILAVMNGHNHSYLLGEIDGTHLVQIPRAEGNQWVLFEIRTDGFHLQKNSSGGSTWLTFKPSATSYF